MSFRVIYGLSWSENGWRMCEVDECNNDYFPGTGVRVPLRQGPPDIIMKAFGARFNQLIEPLDQAQCGGWTPTNSVASSNHLAGTAMDLNWERHPFQVTGTFGNKLSALRNLLDEFEGNIFWGGDWDSPVDEMHFQMGYDSKEGSQKAADFAQKLLNGYLGIYAPADPNAFPLPKGYYYGPLDGPEESISGDFEGDLQSWKDGLGRWQAALGIPVTKHWDVITAKAAMTMQLANHWAPNPDFGYGGIYEAEWNFVITGGWRLPKGWDPAAIGMPGSGVVKWGDYSQYQSAYLTDAYPYQAIAFRASIADTLDTKFAENIKRAKALIATGKLKCVIAYHFWVPGHDNIGTFKKAIETAGGRFHELCAMIDVEDGGAKWNVTGDQSAGVNAWVNEIKSYLGSPLKVCGYLNFNANGGLWLDIQDGLKMVVPRYNGPNNAPVTRAHVNLFGHQYADNEDTPPFGPTDINQSRNMSIEQWLSAWGLGDAPPATDPGSGDGGTGVPTHPVPPADTDVGELEIPTDDDRLFVAIGAQFGG